jgi:hypothetical protein
MFGGSSWIIGGLYCSIENPLIVMPFKSTDMVEMQRNNISSGIHHAKLRYNNQLTIDNPQQGPLQHQEFVQIYLMWN